MAASAALSRLALRLQSPPLPRAVDFARYPAALQAGEPWPAHDGPAPLPQLEFHADAGAPEGAVYVNGELVGWLPGVNRL